MSSADRYVGNELELFAQARNWKAYLASQIQPHLGLQVAEVGAGIGSSTAALASGSRGSWLCLEPDTELAALLRAAVARGALPSSCDVQSSTLAQLEPQRRFDTILYIDVLEHIDDDRAEVLLASERLESNGKLIILSPAHAWLFSPFDAAIGHHRRYTRSTLEAVMPPAMRPLECKYLDSVGLLASTGNRFISRQKLPKPSQVALWDHFMVPLSRVLDPWLRYSLGKSVLGVWQKR
jgi:hypothetical protein